MLIALPNLDPLPLPAPPWFIWALLMLTFVLHLLAMNFVLGGSIIAVVARFGRGEHSRRLAAWLGKLMPSAVATTITLGVAPLLFVQALYGRLFFTSSVLMAWFWLGVIPILILAYYGTYFIAFRGEKTARAAAAVSIVVALLFVGIAFVYCNNMTMMLRPETFLGRYLADGRGVQLNLADSTVVPRFLHMLFGAVAVAGAYVAVHGAVRRRSDETYGVWAMQYGAVWFAASTAFAVLAGAWWTAALPRDVLLQLVGRNALAAVIFTLAIVAGLAAWVLMILAANAVDPSKFVARGGEALLISFIGMVLTRDQVRRAMLDLAQFQVADRVDPQWGVIAIFAVLLVVALAVSAWMIAILLRAKEASAAQSG